ncbi:MAG: TetR family transcriptional regulator [Acidimicrobiia bacterium]
MPRPHGRNEIVTAASVCAIELLAEVGPRAMSVRAVAERAGINHALIHRHLGTKADLIRVALAHSAAVSYEAVRRETRNGRSLAELGEVPEIRRHVRALGRCLLELPAAEGLQSSFPTAGDLAESGIEHGLDEVTARARAVLITAAISGIVIYAPWFAAAVGLPEDRRERVTELLDVALGAVDASTGMPPWPSIWTD